MRIGERFRDKGQQVGAQVAELEQTEFQKGDTVVVYIRSHGRNNGEKKGFVGPVRRANLWPGDPPYLWQYEDVVNMFFRGKKMKGVTFYFFVDACYSGLFIESCESLDPEVLEENSVIVCTSCDHEETTARIYAPRADGPKTEIMTSQFTFALMSVLEEGVPPKKDIGAAIKAKLDLRHLHRVQFCTFGTGSSLPISAALREPHNFRWYEFDKARFCRNYWTAAQPKLVAMIGKKIAPCRELCPKWIQPVGVGHDQPRLIIPVAAGARQHRVGRRGPRSGSNGDERRKDGLSKSDREMIRRLVIESYFRQVQELIWKYYIMEHLWLLGFDW